MRNSFRFYYRNIKGEIMSRILIIEDDKDIVKNLSLLLKEEGFLVEVKESRKAAMKALEEGSFDLILLDVTLPDGNGYSICTSVKRDYDIPIIFLTAMGDESSIVTGFDLGADDYIAKPFKPLELVSRIKNVLRRSGKTQSIFQIGNIKIDTIRAVITKSNQEINLSALEYRLLLVFLNNKGAVLSRSRLLEEIWDIAGDFVNDNTLTVYIKRLREKIEDDPQNPTIIKTIRGLGYKVGD